MTFASWAAVSSPSRAGEERERERAREAVGAGDPARQRRGAPALCSPRCPRWKAGRWSSQSCPGGGGGAAAGELNLGRERGGGAAAEQPAREPEKRVNSKYGRRAGSYRGRRRLKRVGWAKWSPGSATGLDQAPHPTPPRSPASAWLAGSPPSGRSMAWVSTRGATLSLLLPPPLPRFPRAGCVSPARPSPGTFPCSPQIVCGADLYFFPPSSSHQLASFCAFSLLLPAWLERVQVPL